MEDYMNKKPEEKSKRRDSFIVGDNRDKNSEDYNDKVQAWRRSSLSLPYDAVLSDEGFF